MKEGGTKGFFRRIPSRDTIKALPSTIVNKVVHLGRTGPRESVQFTQNIVGTFKEGRTDMKDWESGKPALYLHSLKKRYEEGQSLKEKRDFVLSDPIGKAAVLDLGLVLPVRLLKALSFAKVATHPTVVVPILFYLAERQWLRQIMLSEQQMTPLERRCVEVCENATLLTLINQDPYKLFEPDFDPNVVVTANFIRGSSSTLKNSLNYVLERIDSKFGAIRKQGL